MAFRLAVVFLAVVFLSCGSDGGSSTPNVPQPQWGRGRSDDANSGVAPTSVTNLGSSPQRVRLSMGAIRTTPAIGNDGTVFVMTEDDGLIALDADGTTIQWRFPTAALGKSHCSVAVDGFNNTFFGTDGGFVVGVDSFGVPLWPPVNVGSPVVGSPLLVVDNVASLVQAFFVGTRDGRILGIGAQDGQIRWTFRTGGAIEGSVIFDGLTLYAASSDGFMYFLNQRGGTAFPKVPLGTVAPAFSASPNLFAQVLGQSGLSGAAGGRVRGMTTNAVPIWDTDFAVPVTTSLAQFSRVLNQRIPLDNNEFATSQLTVTDFVAVDEEGAGWFLDPQIGSRGKRCIGGQNDLQPCRTSDDCPQAQVTPTPTFSPVCLPPYACQGGANDGVACRLDTGTADCPAMGTNPGVCLPITKCKGGTRDGEVCNEVDLTCPEGLCDLAIFHVSAPVVAPPVTTTEGTIYVVTAPPGQGGILYAIEPPSTKDPVESTAGCQTSGPEFCRFELNDVLGSFVAAPSIAADGVIYVGDDKGYFYTINSTATP